MRTLGIDLATANGSTGVCHIEWGNRTTTVEVGKFDDDDLSTRIGDVQRGGGWIAIDAPFGFPAAFSQAVGDWCNLGTVDPPNNENIRRRLTDTYVKGRQEIIKKAAPGDWVTSLLSSVSSLITPTVIRCAHLLTQVNGAEAVDRVGLRSHIVEAYPIAVLRGWQIDTKGYKSDDRPKSIAACESIFETLCARTDLRPPGYDMSNGHADDGVDAFVCALLARVVALAGGATAPEECERPTVLANLGTVRQEGWIHLPPPAHRPEDLVV